MQGVKIFRQALKFCIIDYSPHATLYKDFPGIVWVSTEKNWLMWLHYKICIWVASHSNLGQDSEHLDRPCCGLRQYLKADAE
jgi:hypothetical protein